MNIKAMQRMEKLDLFKQYLKGNGFRDIAEYYEMIEKGRIDREVAVKDFIHHFRKELRELLYV